MVGLLYLLPQAGERGDELGALAVMQQAHGVLLVQPRNALLELAGRHGVLLLAAQEPRGVGGQIEASVVHGARGHRLDRGEPLVGDAAGDDVDELPVGPGGAAGATYVAPAAWASSERSKAASLLPYTLVVDLSPVCVVGLF